jgi:hypothetical protein
MQHSTLDIIEEAGSYESWLATHRLYKDGLRCCGTDPIDVLQRELDPLLVRDLHSSNTSSLYPKW